MKKIILTCTQCDSTFERKKSLYYINKHRSDRVFCSTECMNEFRKTNNWKKSMLTSKSFKCTNCGTEIRKPYCEFKDSENHFCSKSCSATYNNTHKKTGCRRSKLEKQIETQLIIIYPDLSFEFNQKTAINSELDIFIPSLSLAFELNGIYHYEPIHGVNKLHQIQTNDDRKYAACYESGIELCIIDVSHFTYFKPERAKKYIDIIISIIENKRMKGFEPPCK